LISQPAGPTSLRARLLLLTVVLAYGASFGVGELRGRGSGVGQGPFPPDEDPQFFPTWAFGDHSPFYERWYSWYLRLMSEPPLADPAGRGRRQVYRVLVLPPHNSPVTVRLVVSPSGTGELSSKIGKSDLTPGVLVVNETRTAAPRDVEDFARLLVTAGFWRTPSVQEDARHHIMGGTAWVLEGTHDGLYHVTSWLEPRRVPCSDAASFLVWNLGKVDLRQLPTRPPGR
jgi:hypothetical protein